MSENSKLPPPDIPSTGWGTTLRVIGTLTLIGAAFELMALMSALGSTPTYDLDRESRGLFYSGVVTQYWAPIWWKSVIGLALLAGGRALDVLTDLARGRNGA